MLDLEGRRGTLYQPAAFPLTVRSTSRTFSGNPVTPVTETLSMACVSVPGCDLYGNKSTDCPIVAGGPLAKLSPPRLCLPLRIPVGFMRGLYSGVLILVSDSFK